MRRTLVLALAVVALLGLVPADVFAQAPAPQVTINGFIQQVTSYRHNYSNTDLDVGRSSEKEWYSRTRMRPDITGRVGKVMARLGLEIDFQWGQSGAGDCTAPLHAGVNCGFDLNGDISSTGAASSIEVRHLYTEFPVTGKDSLMPFIPVDTLGRFGGMPLDVTYKLGVLAHSDAAGAYLGTTWSPNVKTHITYVQVEESVDGAARGFLRGDDFALFIVPEITPMKGLDIRPLYSYFFADGATSGSARAARGGPQYTFPLGVNEHRHTIGFDARWRSGPWSLEPTIFYQFGSRETVLGALTGGGSAEGAVGTRRDADISAWFIDVRGGYRVGPLLVEGMTMWTSGNRARDQLSRDVNFFQPITTDTTYYATWAEILALNVDFNNYFVNLGNTIGYDRYGRLQVGARVFYDLTPALTLEFKTTSAWTDKSVDNDSTRTAGGLQPSYVDRRTGRGARPEGDSSYIGHEFDIGFTWRFAPNVFFQAVYGYLISGGAMGQRYGATTYSAANPPVSKDRNAEDVQIFTARVNYSF